MSEGADIFSTRMRKATRTIHNVSDALVNAKFAICKYIIINALRNEQVWGGGLFIFYHVFAYLEDAKERLNMPEFNKLFKAFEDDLSHYLGESWRSIPKAAALDNYMQHLQDLEKESPKLLMAYVYHMYLGLLKNAQSVQYKDKVTDFTDVDIPQLKKDFREAMNQIAATLSDEEKEALIEEGKQVFIMNNLIVNSVGGQNTVLLNLLVKASAVVLVFAGVVAAYKWYK
ncbi:Heme oxygenase [Operophtera brumata]|uniref:Heme oxygenase n=1 Tax=Operophtera brumata TaxID=104452 RepID=A0A0L7KW73_OPEBR|nr:Heme oxygenase [Operophtera brumata]